MPGAKHAWIIRTLDPNLISTWEEDKIIAIGWPELGDLSDLISWDDFKSRYKAEIAGPASEVAQNVHQIKQFVREISDGDTVVTNIDVGKEILIGTINGEYIYQPFFNDNYPHTRFVNWTHKKKVAEQNNELREKLRSTVTVILFDKFNSENDKLPWFDDDRKKKLALTSAILGIVGGLLMIFAFFVTFPRDVIETSQILSQIFISPGNHLLIQEAQSSGFVEGYVVTDMGSQTQQNSTIRNMSEFCNNQNENTCDFLLYLGDIGSNEFESIQLKVGNNMEEPVIIQGIQIELADYQELGSEPTDILFVPPGRGGGGGYNPYHLTSFPGLSIPQERSIGQNPVINDPLLFIGESVFIEKSCSEGDANCLDYLYLADEKEVEGLELKLSFLKTLPPGRYGFEIRVRYVFQGESFDSNDSYRFVLTKPSSGKIWKENYYKETIESPPVIYDFKNQKYISDGNVPVFGQNPDGLLVMGDIVGIDNPHFILRLQTGEIGTYKDFFGDVGGIILQPITSPNGRYQIRYILEDQDILDLALVDLETMTERPVTNTPFIREISPTWSPSGEKIAFVAYATETTQDLKKEEGDIYVYDINQDGLKRVTYTPSLVETSPVWIDENRISFLLPPVLDYFIEEKIINERAGLGIQDLASGEYKIINESVKSTPIINELSYLAETEMLAINYPNSNDTLYNLNGDVLFDFPDIQGLGDCWLLDINPIKQVCENDNEVFVVDPFTGNQQSLIARPPQNDPNITKKSPLVLGRVIPEGFFILDSDNESIIQYAEDASLIQVWNVQNISQISTGVAKELVLMQDSN